MDESQEAIILAMAAQGELEKLIRLARAGMPLPRSEVRGLALMVGIEPDELVEMIKSVLV